MYLPRLEVANNVLRTKREVVLNLMPNFAQARTRLKQIPPEIYWWWYLDNPTLVEIEQEITYVSPEQLGLTFEEAIIARTGLKPGQSVKVTADAKHILISIQ
jgi:hypothetical protein